MVGLKLICSKSVSDQVIVGPVGVIDGKMNACSNDFKTPLCTVNVGEHVLSLGNIQTTNSVLFQNAKRNDNVHAIVLPNGHIHWVWACELRDP